MPDRKRCCCNCRRNIRTGDLGEVTCHCEIDGHYISYVMAFEGWCRRWARDHRFDDVTEEARYIQTKESEPKEEHDGWEV